MKLKDFLSKKVSIYVGNGLWREGFVTDIFDDSLRSTRRKQFMINFLDQKAIPVGGTYSINVCFYKDKPIREWLKEKTSSTDNKNVSLSEALTYLKEKNSKKS